MTAINMKNNGINVGIFIITDDKSYDLIKSSFSYEAVVNILTICRVHWPKYELNGELDKSIFRCMRYITLGFEELKGKWIGVRDADTIFPYEMYNIAWMMERVLEYDAATPEKKNKLVAVKGDEYYFYTDKYESGLPTTDKFNIAMILGYLIANWETEFINTYKRKPHSIVFGVGSRYKPQWAINYNPSKEENMFNADFGLYAGFVTFFESRPDDIWNIIYLFITMRYSKKITNGVEQLLHTDKNYYIGKDEQLLLYAVLPKYSLQSTFFLLSYVTDIFFKYSILCMRKGGGSGDYDSIADRNGLTFPQQVLQGIIRKKEMNINTIDTYNPMYAMAWLWDGLSPDLQQRLNPFVHTGKIYNAKLSRDNCETRPLSTIMLQTTYIKAVSEFTSILLYGYDRRYSIESIINGHVYRYEKWCKEHFPEWATIISPSKVGGRKKKNTYRKYRNKKRITYKNKTYNKKIRHNM